MLHVEIIGVLAEDAKVVRHNVANYLRFTVVHHEGTQYLGGHSVPVRCEYRIHEFSLLPQLKKGKRVYVKGSFLVAENNGRYGDGSQELRCRVEYIEPL